MKPMTIQRIFVQMGEHHCTLALLHAACAAARRSNAPILFVDMIPAGHPSYLGTEMGIVHHQQHPMINEWLATLEDYGVSYEIKLFQYIYLVEGIAQAADYFDAQLVFVQLPKSSIPRWQQFQTWALRRRLQRDQRVLGTAVFVLPQAELADEHQANLAVDVFNSPE